MIIPSDLPHREIYTCETAIVSL